MKVVCCRTTGCPNNGYEFLWNYDEQKADAEANGYGLGPYFCGGCGQEITDIRDVDDTYQPKRPDLLEDLEEW